MIEGIEDYMKKGATGVTQFLRRVQKTFPVAVVGFFPRRDLLTTRLDPPDAGCGTDAIRMPYFGVHQWKKVTP